MAATIVCAGGREKAPNWVKRRDKTKIYLYSAHETWKEAKAVRYMTASNAKFAEHVLASHRENCHECFPSVRECGSDGDSQRRGNTSGELTAATIQSKSISPIEGTLKDVCQGPIATSTPRKPGICKQPLCEERDSEDTLSAIESDSSDGESDVHSELNCSAGRGNPHVSIEEAVFDVQDTGTDDISNDELMVDDIDDDMNVIEQQKCIAFVPCIVDLLKKSNGNLCNKKTVKKPLHIRQHSLVLQLLLPGHVMLGTLLEVGNHT
ncbi:uncharacterized protein [Ptychodera flava]|uniref:uncharacterized protein isoform X1 n=1 Tax=Ptychodera flava TaxID=63121 RepID=UPI00396A18AC